MAFENIVRPFQSRDVGYPRRIIKAAETAPENVVIKVGENGGVKTINYSRSYSLTTYMEKKHKEVQSRGKSPFTGTWAGSIGQPFGESSSD